MASDRLARAAEAVVGADATTARAVVSALVAAGVPPSAVNVDQLYAEYGEGAPGGNGPDQGRVQSEGNAYLTASFPKLSYINSVTPKGGARSHKLLKRHKSEEL